MCITDFPVRLLGPVEVRTLAEEIGIRPTKNLGQNFVLDPGTVRKIVEISGVASGDKVLEIGPGLGSLTLALLEAQADITVVEIDPNLAQKLPETLRKFAPGKNIRILNKDALRISPEEIMQKSHFMGGLSELDDMSDAMSGRNSERSLSDEILWKPQFLIANLPYNVAVPVLLHCLTILPTLAHTVVMVQKEVAQRLAASVGSKIYGIPSVKARYFGTVAMSRTIGNSVFWPQPRIDSALVIIERYAHAPWPMDWEFQKELFSVIDAAFGMRRKTLRQSLAAWAGSARNAEEILLRTEIDPMRRAETLSIEDFVRLCGMR